MKKIIDEKRYFVQYNGNIEELQSQLGYIIDSFPEFKGMFKEDIENLSNIFDNASEFSNMYERVYYNNARILYRVNSSNKGAMEMIFPIIKEKCKKADCDWEKANKRTIETFVVDK